VEVKSKTRPIHFQRILRFALFGLALSLYLVSSEFAQGPDETAPPPIKMLSKSERTQLSGTLQLKERTALALDLMDSRLRSAEKFTTDENYSLVYAELGGFQALMDNTINFLLKARSDEGKQLKSLKKFEIGLRTFSPRIEVIRRDVPPNFEPYLKDLIKYIADSREKAMQQFYSDTVIPN
jgi:hypothetical protein